MMIVTALNRYAVKGLSGDALTHVELLSVGETFPDDRRFALLQRRHLDEFRHDTGAWLHKEKFLCAFTDPDLLARLRTTYSIRTYDSKNEGDASPSLRLSRGYPNDAPVVDAAIAEGFLSAPPTTTTAAGADGRVRRILTVQDRASGIRLLPELDLNRLEDRERLQDFMTAYSGRDVVCVAGDSDDHGDHAHSGSGSGSTHQFGNTSSGYKQRGDTRTVHIVTQQTVDALSRAAQLDGATRTTASRRPLAPPPAAAARIRPNRFRPNIVVDGGPNLEPFEEFQWIGRRIKVVTSARGRSPGEGPRQSGLELSVIAKTVRCRGVSVDPDDVGSEDPTAPSVVDVPDLLVRHFPQHGPYLGVYAVVESPGILSLGDELSVLPLN